MHGTRFQAVRFSALLVLLLVTGGCASGTASLLCLPSRAETAAGTTVERVFYLPEKGRQPPHAKGLPDRPYEELEIRPGWQRCRRVDLTSGEGDDGGGRTLLSLVHLSDVHVVDAAGGVPASHARAGAAR